MSRFLLRYGLVLTAAWLLLMVAARALGGSVAEQDWIMAVSERRTFRVFPHLMLLDIPRRLPAHLNGRLPHANLTLSPDERYVTYPVNSPNGEQHCELRDLYGGAALRHQTARGLSCEPRWSSDSQRVLFVLDNVDEWTAETLDLTTSATQQVTMRRLGEGSLRLIGAFNSSILTFFFHVGYSYDIDGEGQVMQADLTTGQLQMTPMNGRWGGEYPSADGRWTLVPLTRENLTKLYLLDTWSGAATLLDQTIGSAMATRWHDNVVIHARTDSRGRTTYWRFDPLSGEKVMAWEPTGAIFSFSPDVRYMAILEDGLWLRRWNEARAAWDELFQTDQAVSVADWLDGQTLMVIESNAVSNTLWLYDGETGTRWDVYSGHEWVTPSRWTLDSRHLLLYLTSPDQKVSLVAVNRQSGVMTILIPPSDQVFDRTSDSSASTRIINVYEFGANRVRSLQLDLRDLELMTIQAPVHDWSRVLFRRDGLQPNLLLFRPGDQGIDLYLLDTDQAVATPLLTGTQIDPAATYWVYPAPP